MTTRIISCIRRHVCRFLLFVLGWHAPEAWLKMRQEHKRVIVVVPQVQGWDLFIYYLIYWGYLATNTYLWTNVNDAQINTSYTRTSIIRWLLSSLPIIPCESNNQTQNHDSQHTDDQINGSSAVNSTIKILQPYDDWALIVSMSGWSQDGYRHSGYFYLARGLQADIIGLQLNRYTKSAQISTICQFDSHWLVDVKKQYSLVDSQMLFAVYDQYIPTGISNETYVAWCTFFLSPIDYNVFIPTGLFGLNLVFCYIYGLFIRYPLALYVGLWWYNAWCRIYQVNNRAIIRKTCYDYHYLMQGVLFTEMYYLLNLEWWVGYLLSIFYIFTWDYVRALTYFDDVNHTALNIHWQTTLLVCLYLISIQ